ncbi:MAG: fumarylacetoacetate hydrolase [Betaproteobacteria bacterium]|nr:fumarylacetoacetate hydrolase [Betaproteobacteria bacterium]
MKLLLPIAAITLGMSALSVRAACPSDTDAALMAARFANLQPVPNPPADMSMADAVCGRDKFTLFLGQNYGKVVGYKAGLTNPAVQKRFNFPNPVRGTLFEKMLLKDGVEVPAKFGARPLFEADMVMEVRDAGINMATTPLEALRHISRIYPFIELPDLVVEDPSKITGPNIVYSNVGARLGVLGKPFAVKATPQLVEALANMTVRLTDQDGKELEAGKGNAILGQPLNAVLWLVKDLKASGIAMKKGDLLSLGSFSRLLPPKPGTGAKVTYEGLPGNPSVSVRFK